jgi:hypothetical protein
MKARLTNWIRRSASAVADAAGVATVRIDFYGLGSYALIDRINIACASGTLAIFYVGGISDDSFVDSTTTPTRATADNNSPIHVIQGEQLIAVVSGMTAGHVATVRVQARTYEVDSDADKVPDRKPVDLKGGIPNTVEAIEFGDVEPARPLTEKT